MLDKSSIEEILMDLSKLRTIKMPTDASIADENKNYGACRVTICLLAICWICLWLYPLRQVALTAH
jgi:hypothetical protein